MLNATTLLNIIAEVKKVEEIIANNNKEKSQHIIKSGS